MKMRNQRAAWALPLVASLWPSLASAGPAPFFSEQRESDKDEDKTFWQGAITTSGFWHQESADPYVPVNPNDPSDDTAAPVESASPNNRVFFESRFQLDGRHLSGGKWDLRVDARARLAPDGIQSGLFGGNEFDAKEAYLVHVGKRADFFVGRMVVADMAALKVDGFRLDYGVSKKWTAFGFAGLTPMRGSRSIANDYEFAKPLAGGAGAAYRSKGTYGSIGVGTTLPGILPTTEREYTNNTVPTEAEAARVFLTSNGYTRRSNSLDIYHYAVLDLMGAAGLRLINGSVGVNYRPKNGLTITGNYHHMDTEALQITARNLLEDGTPISGVVINNLEVTRVSSEAVRAGVSYGFGNTQRFELSGTAALRIRPNIAIDQEGTTTEIERNTEGEFTVGAVDRKSLLGTRIALLYVRALGIDDGNAPQTNSEVMRLTISRPFYEEMGEWELEASRVAANDRNAGTICDPTVMATCYGSAGAKTMSGAARLYYQFKKNWFVYSSLEIAKEKLQTAEGLVVSDQPPMTLITAFARIAYRF